MPTVVVTETVLQPMSLLKTSFQKKLALALLSGGPHQNLWSASSKPLQTSASTFSAQGAIPALPRKVKQEHIEE